MADSPADSPADSDSNSSPFSSRSEELACSSPTTPKIDEAEEAGAKIAKMKNKRIKIAEEIVKTEKDYVKNLTIVEKYYHEPLTKNSISPNPIITKDDVRVIFGDLKTIVAFNEQLLFDLDSRFSHWSDQQCIGDVFLTLVHYFKFYSQYVSEYNNSIKRLRTLRETNTGFAKFVQELQDEAANEAGKFLLKDFLIMPVQRIPRYRLLLKEMFSNTWEDHPDYGNLKKALGKVSEIADFVEDQGNNLALRERVIEVQEKLTGKSKDAQVKLLEPGRKFIRECDASVSEKEGQKERHLFLFSDILLVTRAHKGTFEVKKILYLEKMSSIKPQNAESLFVIIDDKLYTLVFKEETEKKKWLNDLVKHYTDYLERETKKKSAQISSADKIPEPPPPIAPPIKKMSKKGDLKRPSSSKEEVKVVMNPLRQGASIGSDAGLSGSARGRRPSTIGHNSPAAILAAEANVKKSPSMDSFGRTEAESEAGDAGSSDVQEATATATTTQ